MQRHRYGLVARLVAVLAGFALLTAACGDDDGDGASGTTDAPGTSSADGSGDGAACDSVTIGWIPWDEDIAVSYLWAHLLEEQGIDVELTQVDVAPVFQGVAQGDLDLFLDTWLPVTHEVYWEEYGDSVEDLGSWYDQATLNIAVPTYVDAESIADLAGRAAEFDNRIVGIEAGAGLMRVTRDEVIPTYGLEDFTLVESSTTAMLAELERAIREEAPIVVTLWHPHWAYAAYDIKDLTDAEGVMGGAEEIHTIARSGFSDDCPEVAGWLSNFQLDDATLASLEDVVFNEYDTGEEATAVEAWLEDEANRAVVDAWIG
jgi:glycine betaine/proline transport system substrate-binding protein